MRVCYFGTYDPSYPRNRIVIDGLRANGVEVIECNIPFWGSTEERVHYAAGGWLDAHFLWNLIRCYVELIRKEMALLDYDVMLVGYPGQLDMYVARVLSWRRRKPLVFDVLMSWHLILKERGISVSSSLSTKLAYWLEWGACKLADRIILDTRSYRDYFCEKYCLSKDRFCLVPLGADERNYHPVKRALSSSQLFRVAYYGKFVPLHGVKYIVEAARILRGYKDIFFVFIGEGTTKPVAQAMVDRYALQNVSLAGWVDKEDLSQHLSSVDVCLGVFNATEQAFYTVPNKIWEGLAMQKAVITGNTPAVRDLLTHGRHLYLCEPSNPYSLAKAILRLYKNPELRERLSCQGYKYLRDNFTVEETGKRFQQYLAELISQ